MTISLLDQKVNELQEKWGFTFNECYAIRSAIIEVAMCAIMDSAVAEEIFKESAQENLEDIKPV